MSFETIRIYRDVPAIDGQVQVPPNKEKNKNKGVDIDMLAVTPTSPPLGTVVRLGVGNRQRGSRYGAQEFFRLYGLAPNEWYGSEDTMASLRTTED